MEKGDAINLIQPAIAKNAIQQWLDLGCGTGTFTYALAECLPHGSHITAIDIQSQHLLTEINGVKIDFKKAHFENKLFLSHSLHGVLMANSLHYVQQKENLIHQLENYFHDKKHFLIVEYDTMDANEWVPYPINLMALRKLFTRAGYSSVEQIGRYNSAFGGQMYAATIH